MYLKKDCNIPNGFHKGRLKGTINSRKIFVNNGTITIRVYPDDIPNGFVKGICKNLISRKETKTSKVVKIPVEFLTD